MRVVKTWMLLISIAFFMSGCFESDEEKLNQALSLYTESTSNQDAIAKARPLFSELAEKSNSKAEYMLANMYLRGDGVVIDNNKALKLLLSASAHGNGDASLLASQFYSQSRYGQALDPDKAKMLLRKSARDGSAIGQLTLGNAYLDGSLGFSMSLKDAHDQLVKVEEGPYRLPAARSLYDIYAEPNQPLFSPEKATAEMERMHAASKDLAFVGPLVLIYSGKQFGEKGESVKSQDKLDLLIADLEKQNRPQAIAMVEFSLGRVTGDQIIKTMLQAVKTDPIEPAFGKVFCSAMSASYFSKNSDSDLNLDDLIKSCMPEAEQNVSTAQLILAAAYGKKGEYRDAYKWAYISYLNGNKQAFALATGIATMNLGGDVDHLNQEAIKARSGYESAPDAHTGSEVLRYYLPWYAPSRTAYAGKN